MEKINKGYLNYILALSKIEEVDLLAMGVLVRQQRQLQFIQGTIALVGIQPAVKNHIESIRLNFLFEIFESEAEAINYLKQNNPG